LPRCLAQSTLANGVKTGAILSDKTLIAQQYATKINTNYRAASYQVCVLSTGPVTGIRLGVADYSIINGTTPLPSQITGLTRFGTVGGSGPTCYVNYLK